MEQFLELYGFIAVVLHAAGLVARSVAAGSAVFLALIAAPLARDAGGADGARLLAQARGSVLVAAAAALVAIIAGAALQAVSLAATLQAPIGVALGAGFMWVAAGQALALLAIAALAAPRARPEAWRRAALCAAALALAALAVGQSHAAARAEDRTLLSVATFLHQAGAALWLGGLPPLLLALRLPSALARRAGRLYSRQAAAGVALIGAGIFGFWGGYLGGTEAVYGTAYGAMAGAKGAMLAALLLLGAGNFALLHGFAAAADGPPLPRVRRFVECETAIGIAVLAAAASLTSLPPAVDLPAGDRASWSEVVERWTPRAPRLTSPEQSDLAIPALQSRLDAGWRSAQADQRPRAFTPGEGELPPRNAEDIAWSEYNHNWAGLAVFAVGLAALLDAGRRVPGVRHWPLLFLGLAGFILVRADPEAWPLGAIGFWKACATRPWCSTSWPGCWWSPSRCPNGGCGWAGSAAGCATCSRWRCWPAACCCSCTRTASPTRRRGCWSSWRTCRSACSPCSPVAPAGWSCAGRRRCRAPRVGSGRSACCSSAPCSRSTARRDRAAPRPAEAPAAPAGTAG